MPKTAINPPQLFNSKQYGFSQIVVAEGKRTVYFAGQVAWDEQGKIVGKGDFAAQARKSFENLRTALQLAGGTMQDVVSLRIYVVQHQNDDLRFIRENLATFFADGLPPTTTWLRVFGLSNPDFLLELEATAVLD